MSVKMLFISDPHFSSHSGTSTSAIQEKLQANRLDKLFDAIKERYKKSLDLIVFLGDYVQGSSADAEKQVHIKRFKDYLKMLEKESDKIFRNSDSIRDRIIIVPGNHDVDRKKPDDALEQFKKDFIEYIHPFRGKSGIVTKFGNPIFVYDDIKLLVACISTVDMSAAKDEDDKTHDIPSVSPELLRAFKGINNKIMESNLYTDYQKVVLSHHPMIVTERGTTVKEYNYTVNGFDFISSALSYGYKTFVHGHLHDYSCIRIADELKPGYIATQIGVPNFDEFSKIFAVELVMEESSDIGIRYLSINDDRYAFQEEKYVYIDEQSHHNITISSLDYFSGILVDRDIEQIITEAKIIKNGDSTRIESASYDCALGKYYKRSKTDQPFVWRSKPCRIEPGDSGYAEIKIKPDETILIYTEENFDIPDNMVLHASPISSWARKGLRVDLSYFVDPGFVGEFCFPVTNMSKEEISISSREPIMSVELVYVHRNVKTNWKSRHAEKARIREQHEE